MTPLAALVLLALAQPADPDGAPSGGDARRTREALREAFQEANEAYREAADAEGERRDELYREAARRYAALAASASQGASRPNGYVLYDLGNARFRLGEYGRAVAAYRRAEILMPRHAPTRRNLELARQNAPGGGPGPKPHPAAAAFFFWHYAMSLSEVEGLAAVSFLALIIILSVRLFAGGPWRRRLRASAIAVGALAGVFVLSSAAKLRSSPRSWAVVTAEVAPVKSEPAGRAIELFPLREGAEVRVVQRAGDWTRIETGSSGPRNRRGWVETRAVEILSEPPPDG